MVLRKQVRQAMRGLPAVKEPPNPAAATARAAAAGGRAARAEAARADKAKPKAPDKKE